ncbi:hypothetical protein [Nitrospira moscoviensis]|uniref:Uncharacterized protein n=1 Tax=Nitrospira moscoviensis TaxID=42253 RepID=A0A0K2GA80_NITMO|nr:hypothetical protein [Nitrospira moscoviensis]ALA57876.1 conserved exported protein of unknown function [Nitrospira moscoviensis]
MRWFVAMLCLFSTATSALASGGHDHHAVPTLKNQTTTTVSIQDNTVTLTFGPIDLPSGHDGELAASMPKHIFQLPKDMYLVGYKSAVFTKEGKELPRNYLHHILMLNNDKPSVSCPGEPLFFGGAGLEMTEARFPEGYGVKLGKGEHLMSVVAFYHKAPPTKNVMATFTMYMAPESKPVKEMDVYQVGVNIVCYSKFGQRGADQTDEGIEIKPGVQVHTAPLKFLMDGCVKFAYPHGHDELLMIALENKTKKQTLLRTVPDVDLDGTFRQFQPHQVYKDAHGFPVTTTDDYEMVMVHHHPLHKEVVQHGMGNYLLYMTPGACPSPKTAMAP